MKRLLAIFSAMIVLLTAFSGLRLTASAESLYIRKIVSVVYDDSGSMDSGNKWAYANYAMQAFCGMLNSEDQLFVTYMSESQRVTDYQPKQVDLSAQGIQDSINAIKNHTDSGSTPFKAVEIAYNKLKSVNDSNPNTQYWLVVITDGSFDETGSMSVASKKQFLNDNFEDYAQSVMPNGTNPQITFLGIGNVMAPDENRGQGIYTYSAQTADDIISAMSQMADQISGRTRLQSSDIQKLDEQTIQVSSAIPLLNIAVFAQGCGAKVTQANHCDEASIPITRSAELKYPNYADLVGGAYLIGDSQTVIGAGTYHITFDRAVDLENVIILFEPALEMRMSVSVNGQEITDYSALDSAMEGDIISVSCKIFEMGTDREIDPSLLPPGTKFEVTILEEGKVAEQVTAQEMQLSGYVLKNVETEINAAVKIEGYNPIDYSKKFTPAQYVHQIVYTLQPSFGGSSNSVELDQIASNKDVTICFTVYADGMAMTDAAAVKALNPVITVSPAGNSGTTTYSSDGQIIFTPNAASEPTDNSGSFDVQVTCTIEDGTKASETYVVEYPIIVYTVGASFGGDSRSVQFDEIAGNQDLSICFTVYADGVAITDIDAVKALKPVITVSPAGNSGSVAYANDGTIIFTPNAASMTTDHDGSFDVEVTCEIEGGATAAEKYTVLIAKYEVIAVNAAQAVKKTELYGNQVGASFYITKDGVKLDKAAVENQFAIGLNETQSHLKTSVVVAQDGTITVTPYSEEENVLNFWRWWFNWVRYFGLPGSDVEITMSHAYGNATAIVDIRGESIGYILLNAMLPLVLEIALVLFIAGYIYCVYAKPKFRKGAVLYSGDIDYDPYTNTHIIRGGELQKTNLIKYNKLKYRLEYTTKSKVISPGGIPLRALRGGLIECFAGGPVFSGHITFVYEPSKCLPAEIADYCTEFGVPFAIKPFLPVETIEGTSVGIIEPTDRNLPTYFVADVQLAEAGAPCTILSGKIFVYLSNE